MSTHRQSNVITSLSPFIGYVESADVPNGLVTVRTGPGANDTFEAFDPSVGGGEAGIYSSLKEGTAVLCQRALSTSRQDTFIISILPNEAMRGTTGYFSNESSDTPDDAPSGFSPYPTANMRGGDVRVIDDSGSEISLKQKMIKLGNAVGGSICLHRDGEMSAVELVAEQHSYASSGGVMRHGAVMRIDPGVRAIRPKGNSSNNIGFDSRAVEDSDERGLFAGNFASPIKSGLMPRNVAISEYRHVVNEFCSDYGFLGMDMEVMQSGSESAVNADSESMRKISRSSEPGNSLFLAPHELVEVIAGNVVDIYENCYDINFNKVKFGARGETVPGTVSGATGSGTTGVATEFERAKRVSRRGLGYHFQLSTNINSTDLPNSLTNFVFGIDKEGVMKLNVPASSGTGNVPFVSSTIFYNSAGEVETTWAKKSEPERIPVTLRGSKGEHILPAMKGSSKTERTTGVRYTNNDEYFPGSPASVRVNFTKHHNICAAAERLIANTINKIIVPLNNNECGFVYGNIHTDGAFERDNSVIKKSGGKKPKILHMAYVEVEPGEPAINPGGGPDCVLAGKKRSARRGGKNKPYTNSFTIDEEGAVAAIDDSEEERLKSGGKSANINFEGAIDVSIGKDETDQKSFVLDTAGSLVAWFGQDANKRSVIVQTDGSMLINVGGSIDQNSGIMNKGRFDLRVNVTELGYIGDAKTSKDFDQQSDYMISISEEGLVIAGCKTGGKMIFRNADDIIIESATKIIMSSPGGIKERSKSRPEKDISADPKSNDTGIPADEASIPAVIDKMTCISDVIDKLSETLDSEDQ